jgi:hypothetical protein
LTVAQRVDTVAAAMDVTIGENTLVHWATFMCEDNVPVRIEQAPLGAGTVRMLLTCLPEPRSGVLPGTLEWAVEDGAIAIRLHAVRNPLGTTFGPTQFGRVYTNEEPRRQQRFYFQLAHYFIGTTNLIHFSLLLGAWNAV